MNNVAEFSWNLNDVTISEDEILTYEISQAGDYIFVLTGEGDENNCVAIDVIQITVESTVEVSSYATNSMEITRVSEGLQVNFNETLLTQRKIQILDALGRIVLEHSLTSASEVITEDISILTRGIYFVQILDNNGVVMTKKFIK